MRTNFCLLALLLLTATASAQPSTLTPERRADARLHYENGQRKFDVAKFDEAAEEFVKAYEIVGDAAILYNIAQSYRLGERHEKALFFYKAFLRRMGDRAPNRVEVEKRIAELTRVLNEAKSATTAPPTGTIPPSGHLESGAKPQPEARPQPEAKPQPQSETKPPQPEQQPQPEPPQPEARHETQPRSPAPFKYAGIALAAVAVAALATGGGMSGAAASSSSAVEDGARNHNMFGPNLQSAESNGRLYDTISYAMYGVGGAAAITAAVLLYLGYKPRPQSSARLTPAIGAHTAGLSMTGSF